LELSQVLRISAATLNREDFRNITRSVTGNQVFWKWSEELKPFVIKTGHDWKLMEISPFHFADFARVQTGSFLTYCTQTMHYKFFFWDNYILLMNKGRPLRI
jgi:hypothetical protein